MDDPETACGEDCLNRLLLIEWYYHVIYVVMLFVYLKVVYKTFMIYKHQIVTNKNTFNDLLEATIPSFIDTWGLAISQSNFAMNMYNGCPGMFNAACVELCVCVCVCVFVCLFV